MREHTWWRVALLGACLSALSATYLYSVFSVQPRIVGGILGLVAVGLGLMSYRAAGGTPAWWRATLLTTWFAGLIWTLLYATFSVVPGIIGGVLAVAIGIAGYRTVGGPRNLFWRVQMASMLPLGVFIYMHPLADWRNGVPQTWLSIPVGLLFVITACWGLWPDGRQPAPRVPQPSP